MNRTPAVILRLRKVARRMLLAYCCLLVPGFAWGQVNPIEIQNPQLKAAEEKYFPQLKTLNRAIAALKPPFPFVLSRYVGLDPQQQLEADTRGLEFVKFHDRVVLKATGNYNAAFNADMLTQNQRAAHVFTDVVVPVLQLITDAIPPDVTCDAIGLEVAYHVRRQTKNSDYEGKEILVVVFDREDAFTYVTLTQDSERQRVLNRSEIYVNGNEFGLALGEKDALSSDARQSANRAEPQPPASSNSPLSNMPRGAGVAGSGPELPPGFRKLEGSKQAPVQPGTPAPDPPLPASAPAATQADADRLQAKYQPQLDALAKDGAEKYHLVDYAPPSLVVFRDRIYLQLTLRNPSTFDASAGSIYKRAARSFDLFLAQHLKAMLEKIPADAEIEGLDVSVLNQLTAKKGTSSEAVEFVLPMKPLRQFVDAGITNQDLINQSVVLVNGVRIALNLQLVE